MTSSSDIPIDSRHGPGRGEAEEPQMATTRQARPSRNAAGKANAKISAVALRETSPEKQESRNLLAETLTTFSGGKRDESSAWVEIESEPAFFNGLLRDLGVKDVRVVEMFSVSVIDVQLLPQPVLGFVFLCQYAGEEEKEDAPNIPKELWFANQTMANGCATVALLNILMNRADVPIGKTLQKFKAQTADKTPFLRGWLLESNASLRQIHNSYARTIELLNADLFMANDWEECDGSADKPKSKRRRTTSRKKNQDESAGHYKAFVHQGGQVWVLDGLEANPVSLGEATEATWIPTALQGIADKMAVAGDMVNVLAVCQSPIAALRKELLVNLKTLVVLLASLPNEQQSLRSPNRIYADEVDDATLSKYGISRYQLRTARVNIDIVTTATSNEAKKEAIKLLETEQARILSEFSQEMSAITREEELCAGRKKDFSPAIHRWVEKLAERSVLQGLVG